jgi:hypothetical protein
VIGTANAIVEAMMAKVRVVTTARPLAGRMLSTALAHRIFSDIRRINEFAKFRTAESPGALLKNYQAPLDTDLEK